MDNNNPDQNTKAIPAVRPEVLKVEDVCKMAPALAKHPKLVERVMHFLRLDEINRIHAAYCDTPGVEFAHRLIADEFKFKLRIDNLQVLSRFPEQPFITVSNHPFGSYDGILLLDIVGEFRPDFKVMVNLILNNIQAMRPNFIAVDPLKSDDPEKKKVTMQGIREAMKHVKSGHPLGFFPAGAMSKLDKSLTVRDREWQPSIIRLIKQLQVPVIPIFFHGHNSWIFNALGLIDWRLRSLRLPREVIRAYGREVHVSIGEPISVERQNECESVEALSALLRGETYALKAIK